MTQRIHQDLQPAERRMTLNDAVLAYIRELCKRRESRQTLPDPADVAGRIGSLMGLDKAERKKQRTTINATFLKAWVIAGLPPLKPRIPNVRPLRSAAAIAPRTAQLTLSAAVATYIEALKATGTRLRPRTPQPAEVASSVGILLGLNSSEQKRRKAEMWESFYKAWSKATPVSRHPNTPSQTPPKPGEAPQERHPSCFCDLSRPNVLCGFCHARKYGAHKAQRSNATPRRAHGRIARSSMPQTRFQLRCSNGHSWVSDASSSVERRYEIPKCNQCSQYYSDVKKVRATFKEGTRCDPRCRTALGDICVCSCAGANHGTWAR